MNISQADLAAEVTRALASWPWIPAVERSNSLPPGTLLAVGSRETNLTNELGDGGHGHGVWQLDDRSHQIPAGFDQDVRAQGTLAAAMLHSLLNACGGDLRLALAAYNAGLANARAGAQQGNPDLFTTGHDYGADVVARRLALVPLLPAPTTPSPAPHPAPSPIAAPRVMTLQEDDMALLRVAGHPEVWQTVPIATSPGLARRHVHDHNELLNIELITGAQVVDIDGDRAAALLKLQQLS